MTASTPMLITFLVYNLGMVLIGFIAYRATRNFDDYILGGRRMGSWVTALSAGASDMSGWLLKDGLNRFAEGIDLFGYHAERKAERALTTQFEADIGQLIGDLNAERLPIAIELARLPDEIRGYGQIKAAAMQRAAEKREALLARWRAAGHRPANVA